MCKLELTTIHIMNIFLLYNLRIMLSRELLESEEEIEPTTPETNEEVKEEESEEKLPVSEPDNSNEEVEEDTEEAL